MAVEILSIADAVTTELNLNVFNPPLVAERLYVPVYDLKTLKTLKVSVVPRGVDIGVLTRAKCQYDYQIDVGVQKKLDSISSAEVDPLLDLVQQIADFMRFRDLSAFPAARWAGIENDPVYNPQHMDKWRQFTSVLTLTYKTGR